MRGNMPIIFQSVILRRDLHANRRNLYLFGDNEERKGLGGQAGEMRGEPNAHGIRTKKAPSYDKWAMWDDEDFERIILLIKEDFEKPYRFISDGRTVVVPTARFGTGRGDLPDRAPRIFAYIERKIEILVELGESIEKSR